MLVVRDHTGELNGQPVFWHSSQGPDAGEVPTLFVHGVPTSADDWIPFLERVGGIAPDLPGFGRSTKRGDGDFTMEVELLPYAHLGWQQAQAFVSIDDGTVRVRSAQ